MADPAPNPRRALAFAAAAIVLWSALATLGLKLRHVPPFLLVGCALLLGSTLGWRHVRLRETRPGVLALGIYGLFAYHFCLFVALRWAPPVEANLLNYLWPLLIVLLSPVVLPGTRLRARHVAGALLGFGGAALLVSRGAAASGPAGSALPGYLLAVAAAVIWSTYSLLTRRVAPFPTSSVAAFCLASGLLSLACHAAFEPRYLPTLSDAPWLLLVGLGPMGAAFYLWDAALKEGDPRAIGTFAYATPLLSTMLVAASGEGTLTGAALAGAGLIVGGALIGTR
ncbi:MAG TPA: EamA family transporter [Anaeromyxobacteraceae bacterium]|nr:EamA family transporter [Anaeromyxobacteraceae bacterium]